MQTFFVVPGIREIGFRSAHKVWHRRNMMSAIGRYRRLGFTYQAISDSLNRNKIQTISGTGMWNKKTVWRLNR